MPPEYFMSHSTALDLLNYPIFTMGLAVAVLIEILTVILLFPNLILQRLISVWHASLTHPWRPFKATSS